MNRINIIFIFLSVYIIIAFGWWTYSHIRDNNAVYDGQKSILEMLCYKATMDINGGVQEEQFSDTSELKFYFNHNYPTLEIIFDTEKSKPFDNYLIRPKKDSYDQIEETKKRKIFMYTSEGIAMALLLFWGIVLIYRSLNSQIRLKREQSNFLLSITHEFKTPLASIKLYIETLKKRKLDTQQTETILHNSLVDVERLHDLVENLLIAAQLDNHKYEPFMKEISLSKVLNDSIDKFSLPRELHKKIIRNIQEEVFLNADENAIIIIINNLLSNALKYSPENSNIEIFLSENNEYICLKVINDGPCIPDHIKKKLFSRFFRAGDENTRRTKGTGLGLFIVKNLLNLHHAVIVVKDKLPQGVIFEIQFKK